MVEENGVKQNGDNRIYNVYHVIVNNAILKKECSFWLKLGACLILAKYPRNKFYLTFKSSYLGTNDILLSYVNTVFF